MPVCLVGAAEGFLNMQLASVFISTTSLSSRTVDHQDYRGTDGGKLCNFFVDQQLMGYGK